MRGRSGSFEKGLRAAIKALATGRRRLPFLLSLVDEPFEPLVPKIVLEFLSLERDRIWIAVIADPVKTSFRDDSDAGRIGAHSPHDGTFGRALPLDDEAIDERRNPRQRIAAELLTDAQRRRHALAHCRTERRRLDPEIMRRGGGCEQSDDENKPRMQVAALAGRPLAGLSDRQLCNLATRQPRSPHLLLPTRKSRQPDLTRSKNRQHPRRGEDHTPRPPHRFS